MQFETQFNAGPSFFGTPLKSPMALSSTPKRSRIGGGGNNHFGGGGIGFNLLSTPPSASRHHQQQQQGAATVTSPLSRNLFHQKDEAKSGGFHHRQVSFNSATSVHNNHNNSSNASIGGGGNSAVTSGVASPFGASLNTFAVGGISAMVAGDRFIPCREFQDQNMSHYLLTAQSNDQLPQHLQSVSGGSNVSSNGIVSAGGTSGLSGFSSNVNGSVLEASAPAFAGSPNASPNRTNNQNRNPNAGRGGGEEAGSGAASATTGGPQPYSRTLAQVLFPESRGAGGAANGDGSAVAGGVSAPSVLGFRSTNRPSITINTSTSTEDECGDARRLFSSSTLLAASTAPRSETFRKSQGVVYQENRARNFQSKSFRVIPQTPERILDAPELLDDFYLNLLDWSSTNVLAVALGSTAYLWNAEDGSITQLMSAPQRENIITAVSWQGDGSSIAVGLNDGTIQLWDPEAQKLVRSIGGHAARVCSLSWNGGLLASGSRDTSIHMHDHRDPFIAGSIEGHTQEVCGLRWSPNGSQLASGGNDNLLNIWDYRRSMMEVVPLWQLRDHTAAVKALAWNPRQSNLLVSGGGTADKTLRFWDTSRGECINRVDTLSQVCGVMWNHDGTELVSSHGYSDNQLTLWKYPSMKRLADLTGHTSRVLHLSMSPDGQTVVSAAGDETIRFWRCFPPDSASTAAAAASNPFLYSSPVGAGVGGSGGTAGSAYVSGGPASPNRKRNDASSPVGSPSGGGAGNSSAFGFDDHSGMLR